MSGVAIRVEHCHVPARVARCEAHVLPPPDGHAVARCTLVSVLRQVCSVTSDVSAVWMQESDPEALDLLNPGLDLSYGRHRSDIMPDGAHSEPGRSDCRIRVASDGRRKIHISLLVYRQRPSLRTAMRYLEQFLPKAFLAFDSFFLALLLAFLPLAFLTAFCALVSLSNLAAHPLVRW